MTQRRGSGEPDPVIEIEDIRAALGARRHRPASFRPDSSHAGVAMILADGRRGLEACFIRRAERDGDPWSGQVAFPGGRAGPGDADALAVAERETREEIGLSLAPGHRVGALPVKPVGERGGRAGLTLSPFVYHVDDETRATAHVCLPSEVAHVFWVPLAHLFDTRATTEIEYPFGGQLRTFPGIRFEKDVIWGLTLGILESFAGLMQRRLPTDGTV